MLKRIIIGLAISTVSFFLLRYNEWLVSQTGTSAWAEKWFGSEGGTRLLLKFFSLLGFVVGMLVIFNMHERFVRFIFSPLFKTPLT
ncbi:MAG: hypothetical protein HY564_00420 [Candidatus Jacksonbacteria bacterium]|nr:hypothetical protein [Candidatus Jacksonbacteria bacterium]